MKNFFNLLFHFKWKELLVNPTDDGFIQFFRFIFVGGFATLVDIGVGWLFDKYVFLSDWVIFGIVIPHDVLSVAVGFIFGLVTNYFLSIIWVFRRDDINRVLEFLSFAIIGIVGLLIKSGVVWVLGNFLTDNTNGSWQFLLKSFIGTMIAFIWNFAARKIFIYNKPGKKKNQEEELKENN